MFSCFKVSRGEYGGIDKAQLSKLEAENVQLAAQIMELERALSSRGNGQHGVPGAAGGEDGSINLPAPAPPTLCSQEIETPAAHHQRTITTHTPALRVPRSPNTAHVDDHHHHHHNCLCMEEPGSAGIVDSLMSRAGAFSSVPILTGHTVAQASTCVGVGGTAVPCSCI